MPAPNLFLIYVTDVERATEFYSDLFDIHPAMTTPRYVAFEIAPRVLFSLRTGVADAISSAASSNSEVGVMTPAPK